MGIINGLSTVNGGEIKDIYNVPDPNNTKANIKVEILRPEKHNPYAKIICYYYWDPKQQCKKELTCYKLIDGSIGFEIYYFKNKNSLHHYKSYRYLNPPKKYEYIIEALIKCHKEVFGE